MVGAIIKADIAPLRTILGKYMELAGHPLPLMETAGGILENSTRERFMSGRAPGGIPWPVSKRAQLQGGRTLIDKGGLVSSITHRVTDRSVEVGIIPKTESAKFAYVHHFGATIRPKRAPALVFRAPDGHLVITKQVTIPRRPIIGLDEADRTDLMEAWLAQLREVWVP